MGGQISTLRGWRATRTFFSLSLLRRFFRTLSTPAAKSLSAPLPAPPQPKHILIVGGAYGGLSTLITIQKILSGAEHTPGAYNLPPVPHLPRTPPRITILDERDGIYHTVGTPLAHTSPDVATTLPRAWKRFADIPYLRDVAVLQGSVTGFDPARKELSYLPHAQEKEKVVSYDYLVCATGLRRAWPVQPRALTKGEYIHDATALVKTLVDAQDRIVVVGGGAVGTEFAAEIKQLQPQKRVTLIHSRATVLSGEPLPEEFKTKAVELLEELGVEVLLNTRVLAEGENTLQLSTGEEIKTSAVVWCVGRQHPSTTYIPAAALNDAGLVKVTENLTFPPTIANSSAHFALGDIAKWTGIKRVGSALMMGSFVGTSLLMSIAAEERGEAVKMAVFPEIVPMLVLALGEKAVSYHPAYGLTHGVEPRIGSFGDDLGLSVCWRCLNIEVDGVETVGETVKEK